MNILILSWRGPGHPLEGGAEQVTQEYSQGWIKKGHKVTLFTSSYDKAKPEEIVDGVRVIRKGGQILGVKIAAFKWYLFNKNETFDLIIDQFHGFPFFTPLYVRVRKLAMIQETTKSVWFLNPYPFPFNWILGGLFYILEPVFFLFYRSIYFMTGSNSAKKDLEGMGISAEKIFVVNHGVEIPQHITRAGKNRIFTVCYLGIQSKDKGIEDAIKVFKMLDVKGKFIFWVIGRFESKEYERKVKHLVESLGLRDKVKFWGHVTFQEKFKLLSQSHILLNPSIREGWGLVNIEANFVGVPVVGYEVSGMTDSVKDGKTGFLVKKGDVSGLVRNILKVRGSKKLYKRISRESKRWSRNFDWRRASDKSLEVLNYVSNK